MMTLTCLMLLGLEAMDLINNRMLSTLDLSCNGKHSLMALVCLSQYLSKINLPSKPQNQAVLYLCSLDRFRNKRKKTSLMMRKDKEFCK